MLIILEILVNTGMIWVKFIKILKKTIQMKNKNFLSYLMI